MEDFTFHKPANAADAVAARAESEDGLYLAGGQSLIPVMKQGLAQPTALIDVSRIPELSGISSTGAEVSIGAAMRHAEVAASADVRSRIPALASLADGIGDPQVRNRGTLGGSIANNDPAADYPAALLGLGAVVHTDRRSISAEDFFVDMFETALEEDELIIRVAFPVPELAAYAKFPHPATRFALVGVFVSRSADGVRVAVTGAGPGVFRTEALEAALTEDLSPAALVGIEAPAEDLLSDMHASADYRAHLISVMAKRAVTAANERSEG